MLLDEPERFRRSLGEILRSADGVLIEAAGSGLGVASPTDPSSELPTLTAAVEEVLAALNEIDPTADLRLEYSGGSVQIAGRVAYPDANSADKAVRDTLCSVFDPSLRSSPLVCLLWEDEHFDEVHSAILWPFLCRLAALLSLPAGVTLILVAGAAWLRPGLHCSGRVSLRHRITADGFASRQAWESSRAAILEQRALDRDEASLFVMFLGAGASVQEGLDAGNALRNRSLAHLTGLARVDANNFGVTADQLFRDLGAMERRLTEAERRDGPGKFAETLTLERLIREEQARENRDDTYTLRAFARDHDAVVKSLEDVQCAGGFADDPIVKLLQLQRRVVVVTVNFDRVIEAKAPGLTEVFVTDEQLAGFPSYLKEYRESGGRVPVLKLHGDIGIVDSLVADTDQTGGGLKPSRLSAMEALMSSLKCQPVRPWWWIGYSMRDLDLESQWGSAEFADLVTEHWIAPFIDPAVRAFHQRWRLKRWGQKRGYTTEDRVVTLTAADFFGLFFEEVAQYW